MWFFSENNTPKNNKHGLSVSVKELIDEQKYLPYLELKNNAITSTFAGDVKSAFKGRGMELEEVREYGFGDDVRDIDWRVTARKGAPFTRVYAEEKDRKVFVLLDLSASMVFGTKNELKSVTAAKISALLGLYAIKNKDRFGILIYDGKNEYFYKPQNTKRNLLSIIKKISQTTEHILSDSNFGDLSKAIKTLQQHVGNNSTVFILSDFYRFNQQKFNSISALAKQNKVYCFNIYDVLEENAPADGFYEAQYDSQKVEINSYSDEFKLNYKKYFTQKKDLLKKNCQKFSCKYVEIRTDIPIFKQLRLN